VCVCVLTVFNYFLFFECVLLLLPFDGEIKMYTIHERVRQTVTVGQSPAALASRGKNCNEFYVAMASAVRPGAASH